MSAADVTFATARAELVAAMGEPTFHSATALITSEWWLGKAAGDAAMLTGYDGRVVLSVGAHPGHRAYTLAGIPADGRPLTPLADAVRDAGAWLRGRREVGDG